jgi:hypothetical protein
MNAIEGFFGPPQLGKRLIFGCIALHAAGQSASLGTQH